MSIIDNLLLQNAMDQSLLDLKKDILKSDDMSEIIFLHEDGILFINEKTSLPFKSRRLEPFETYYFHEMHRLIGRGWFSLKTK